MQKKKIIGLKSRAISNFLTPGSNFAIGIIFSKQKKIKNFRHLLLRKYRQFFPHLIHPGLRLRLPFGGGELRYTQGYSADFAHPTKKDIK